MIEAHSYKRPQSYSGPDYPNTISIAGQSRDSDCLERSNFRSAVEILGGESETVMIIRDSHWAVGWVETLRVDLSDKVAADKALQILAAIEDYPVLDEGDFSELENEEREACAEQSKKEVAQVLVKVFGLPEDMEDNSEMLDLCFSLQIEHQYQSGLDSSLMTNPYHITELDERDTRDFVRALEGLLSNHSEYYLKNKAFCLIAACFGIDVEKVS